MQKTKFSKKNNSLSCENYLAIYQDEDIVNYCDIANKMHISLLAIDNVNISQRNKFLEVFNNKEYSILSPQMLYEELRKNCFDFSQFIDGFKKALIHDNYNKVVLVSRKTFSKESIEELKSFLSSNRSDYELICLKSKNQKLLKWAAKDRRIDYISIDLLDDSSIVDNALCSLMKQNDKNFEIILSSLLNSNTEKVFSAALRNGKKIVERIDSNNTPMIFTIKPSTPYQLRTSSQIRHITQLLGIPYNKTKSSTFHNQLVRVIKNVIKLHDTHLFEGIKEGS
ncbi:MAG: RNase P subunit p30 family protein [Candidatus Heimdallarchaeota archaeon]